MTTQEGLDAWMHTYNAELGALPPEHFAAPAMPALSAPQRSGSKARKEKNRRKMAKASRKQNRRK